MALRDQPYIPLYVQDVLTDEKLIDCSAQAHGIYFRLICILHKQQPYGTLCLKQKYKQTDNKYENFALMLCKQMPFDKTTLIDGLKELDNEGVIKITLDQLIQKRMVKDGELSLIRAESGKKGGCTLTKQYGKKGYLYWMGDRANKNKIGISVNPQNRLYRLRSDLKIKNFDIQDFFEVEDMGKSEDYAQEFLADHMDGEWVNLHHNFMEKEFALIKANIKAKIVANSENEIENEIENESNKIISRFLSVFNRQPQEHEMLFFNQMSLRLPEKVILDFINDFVEYRDQKEKFNWKYFQGYFRGKMKDYEAEAEKVEKQKEMIQSAKDRKLSAEQQLEASKQLELDTWTTFKEAKLSETHRKLILPMIQNKKFLQALSRIQELRTDNEK